ncbi:MAG: DUF721 domain-containing protein [Nocardioidaceae bacterium]
MSADDATSPGGRDGSPHDPNGLDLARSVARAYRGVIGNVIGNRGGGRKYRRLSSPTRSGSHPDDRDPQPLDATLDRLVAEHGWGRDLAAHAVFGRWDLIVGTDVAAHCTPERYADTELVVRADSTAWATQMRLLASTVVRRLNTDLGDGAITRIQVLGPVAPSWRRGPRSVRNGRGPRDTYG